ALAKNWIDAQYAREELAIKQYNAGSTEHEQTIHITGGLPALPGTRIDMPVLNGHAVSEQLLSAPKDVVPAEPAPADAKTQGPHHLQEHHFRPDAPGTNSTNGHAPDGRLGATEERRDSAPETWTQEPLT